MLMPSIVKSALFATALAFAVLWGGFFWGAVFFGLALYWYFRSSFEWDTFFYSFLILTLYAYLGTSFLYYATGTDSASGVAPVALAAGLFGVLFFLLLGIKEFLFLRRQAIFNFLSGALYFLVAGTFFVANKDFGGSFILYALLSSAACYLLMKESIEFFMEDAPKRKKDVLTIGSTLLVFEFLAIVGMLPIGFLNSAALIVLVVFVFEDLIYHHLKGDLDRQIVMNNVTILIVCLLFIFATSKLTF